VIRGQICRRQGDKIIGGFLVPCRFKFRESLPTESNCEREKHGHKYTHKDSVKILQA
jgi:hypothetical protein